MIEYHLQRIYIWIAFSILLLAFVLIRWFYYRKFKSDRVKRGDIVHNLTDGTKSTVSKVKSESELTVTEDQFKNMKGADFMKLLSEEQQDDFFGSIVDASPFFKQLKKGK